MHLCYKNLLPLFLKINLDFLTQVTVSYFNHFSNMKITQFYSIFLSKEKKIPCFIIFFKLITQSKFSILDKNVGLKLRGWHLYLMIEIRCIKVHIFWEGHKILRNLHLRFDWHYIGQIYDGNFAKFCGFLRIYKL